MEVRRNFIFYFSFCFLFLFFAQAAYATDHLVISEVQTGSSVSATDEFIEIYNPTSQSIDLSSWSIQYKSATSATYFRKVNLPTNFILPPQGHFLLCHNNFQGQANCSLRQGSIALASEGGNIFLVNHQNLLETTTDPGIVDRLAYGTGDSPETQAAPAPSAGQSLERLPGNNDNSLDTDNNFADFFLQNLPNPTSSPSGESPPKEKFAVVINEIFPNPSDSLEWIEIYNPNDQEVNLSNWTLNDGAGKIKTLDQNLAPHGFLVIELSSARLNNSGDIVILKNSSGEIVDQVTYGQWDDGNLEDNAPVPPQGFALARQIDGRDSNLDNVDFQITSTATKGQANVITSPPPRQAPNPSDLVINEFVPIPLSGEKEWIEIYLNKKEFTLLEDFKIFDSTGKAIYTFKNTDSLSPEQPYIVVELSSRLNNTGDFLVLKDFQGQVIDQVTYGNFDDGNLADNAPQPKKAGQSIARKSNGLDTNLDKDDFDITDSPTKMGPNVITHIEIEKIYSSSPNQTEREKSFSQPNLLISELVSDPRDDEEWVEIYNNSGTSVSLADYYLEEGSGSKTLAQGTLDPYQFWIFSPIKGNLNNSGDILYLKDKNGNVLDKVTYGSFDDGNISDNLPAARQPFSLCRSNLNVQAQENNFVLCQPTKGFANQPLISAEIPQNGKIILNELLPNPSSDSDLEEFIELKNLENKAISLANWVLQDASLKKFIFPQIVIEPLGFLLLERSQTKIVLNNDKDEVFLFDSKGKLVDQVKYQGAKKDFSWARDNQGGWHWTKEITPQAENIFSEEDEPIDFTIHIPEKIFVGEETEFFVEDSPNDLDSYDFLWQLENQEFSGPSFSYIFPKAGKYNLKLIIKDNQQTQEKNFSLEVFDPKIFQNLFLSEIYPNPQASSQEEEWIEIYNSSSQEIDLTDFQIDDSEGGSRPFKIKNKKIAPFSFLVFERPETKIFLNNDGDSVRLFDPLGNLLEEISYEDAPVGLSFSRQANGEFIWTKPSKGTKNFSEEIFVQKNAKSSKTKSSAKKGKNFQEVSLEEAKDLEIGSLIKTKGIVSVPPGILGSQIFYLSGSGIQVFLANKNFPDLKVGDLVEVEGEISQAFGERRIKLPSQNNIKIISSNPPPECHHLLSTDLSLDLVGSLVCLEGIVLEKKNNQINFADNEGEFLVYLKKSTNLSSDLFEEGRKYKVQGILSVYNNNLRILPRFQEDIASLEEKKISLESQANSTSTTSYSSSTWLILSGAAGAALAFLFRRSLFSFLPLGFLKILSWRKKEKIEEKID